jgi:hypothetical protein
MIMDVLGVDVDFDPGDLSFSVEGDDGNALIEPRLAYKSISVEAQ